MTVLPRRPRCMRATARPMSAFADWIDIYRFVKPGQLSMWAELAALLVAEHRPHDMMHPIAAAFSVEVCIEHGEPTAIRAINLIREYVGLEPYPA